MAEIIPGVLQHHEKMDGSGYPLGLPGKSIHLFARIISVADVFHALTSQRPYRTPMPPRTALRCIREGAREPSCPECVVLFCRLIQEQPEFRCVDDGVSTDVRSRQHQQHQVDDLKEDILTQTNILLESGTNEFEIVEFYLDESAPAHGEYRGHYGVNVAKVLEIIRIPEVTAMPQNKHPCILGTFNLRSRVVPLVNLSVWLGKNMIATDAGKVIVTEFNHVINSFLVSGVNRIHRLSWEQVEPPGDHLMHFSGGCITGVVKFEDRIIMILDMEHIVADMNPELGPRVSEDEPIRPQAPSGPIKILFADDSSMIRKTLGRGLVQAGFEVTAASDGKIAWDMLLDLKAKADASGRRITDLVNLVISDVEMPAMDGHNLTKRIKSDPVLKELPVILFSSLISDALRHKGESVGADEQIAKPDIATLTGRVKRLLAERQGIVFD